MNTLLNILESRYGWWAEVLSWVPFAIVLAYYMPVTSLAFWLSVLSVGYGWFIHELRWAVYANYVLTHELRWAVYANYVLTHRE